MKFLCVSCDEPMKLTEAKPPERGSLTVVFRCPHCSHEIAMLTNPYETQAVGSLGVEIGADPLEAEASKCPFSDVVKDMGVPLVASDDDGVPWSTEALARLEKVPQFARPMAKTGIEKYARDRGLAAVDAQVLEQAREFFGM